MLVYTLHAHLVTLTQSCWCWQFSLFLKNSFALLFLLFFTFQLAMISLAFLLSTAVAKASSGTNLVRILIMRLRNRHPSGVFG